MGPPEVAPRLALAVLLALTAGAAAWIIGASSHVTMDFEYYWRGARAYFAGADPYRVQPDTPAWPLSDRLFYPLPALLLLWPVHALSERAAAALFVGVPAGLLAWRLSRGALWPLLLFASPAFLMTVLLGQWSPWIVLGMVAPWAGGVFLAKPSLGLAALVARPSRGAVVGCLLLGLASLVAGLGWVAEWRANLATLVAHPAPLFTLAGCWIALVVVRWRSRDARLVLAFAAVPQLLFFADQLPLLLVARDRRELAFLVLAGWAVAVPWLEAATPGLHVRLAAPYVLLGVYGPAVYLTLRRA